MSLALLVLALAVGFGRQGRRKAGPVHPCRHVFFIYSALLAAIVWTYQSEGEPTLLLGFPVSTALLVYGIWPVGFIPGILYLLIFENSVLPRDKLQKFMAEFGRQEQDLLSTRMVLDFVSPFVRFFGDDPARRCALGVPKPVPEDDSIEK